jgi:hypothetical protein
VQAVGHNGRAHASSEPYNGYKAEVPSQPKLGNDYSPAREWGVAKGLGDKLEVVKGREHMGDGEQAE